MNTWVLPRDLSELVEDPERGSVSVFAKTLKDNYVGPVDIQVLNSEGELMMYQPESELGSKREEKYLTLLGTALKSA